MAVSINRASGRHGRRRRSTAFSEINVTPFVDVMLVLLVIFMVTAPMLTVGVPVELPKTKAAKMNDQTEPLVVSVDANGKAYLQETELEGDALIERLIAVSGSNPDAKIYVRGDQKINYGRVMEIMGNIAAAGFSKVSLIAEMPSGPDKGKNLQVRKTITPTQTPVPQVGNIGPQGVASQGTIIPGVVPPPSMPQVVAPPRIIPQQRMQPAPISQVRSKANAVSQMPTIRTIKPTSTPANGPKVVRSQ
jgi:biopolymer transport protein TolR